MAEAVGISPSSVARNWPEARRKLHQTRSFKVSNDPMSAPGTRIRVNGVELIPKAFWVFDEAGRVCPSSRCDRIAVVMEKLVKFTLLPRDRKAYLVDR